LDKDGSEDAYTQSRYRIANSGEKAFLGVGTHDLDASLKGGNTDQKQIDQRDNESCASACRHLAISGTGGTGHDRQRSIPTRLSGGIFAFF
tara:strand:- start:189 stop:461 length:273 start_codon:yes stop_codon:yes gene_type:complete